MLKITISFLIGFAISRVITYFYSPVKENSTKTLNDLNTSIVSLTKSQAIISESLKELHNSQIVEGSPVAESLNILQKEIEKLTPPSLAIAMIKETGSFQVLNNIIALEGKEAVLEHINSVFKK